MLERRRCSFHVASVYLLFLNSSCALPDNGPEKYYEALLPGYQYRVVGVGRRAFRQETLREIGVEFESELRKKGIVAGTLWIVETSQDQYMLQPRPPGESFVDWKAQWHSLSGRMRAVARVSVISGGARLEVRTQDGVVRKETLSGLDPFRVKEDGKLYELCYLSASLRPRSGSAGDRVVVYSLVMMQISGPKDIISSDLMRKLGAKLRTQNVFMQSQSHTWFREEGPVVYPFAPIVAPPEEAQLAAIDSWCSMVDDVVSCGR